MARQVTAALQLGDPLGALTVASALLSTVAGQPRASARRRGTVQVIRPRRCIGSGRQRLWDACAVLQRIREWAHTVVSCEQ